MKKLIMGLGMVMLVIVMTACGNDERNENVLRMGTSADFYPMQFIEIIDGNEVIVGFDIDIANYIADALGMELEISDMDFNTLITALRAGRVDMVLASMAPTEERLEVVDFSQVYYQSNPGMLLASANLSSLEDLNGLTMGVQTGSLQETIGNSLIEDGIALELLIMDRIPDLIQQLLAGRVDVIIVNELTAIGHINAHDGLYMIDIVPPTGLGSAIAFPQGSELTEQVNEILTQMEENGTMEALVEQWLSGVDLN